MQSVCKYVNSAYGHIFTGNLEIVGSNQLCMLLNKGLNYRDHQVPDKKKKHLNPSKLEWILTLVVLARKSTNISTVLLNSVIYYLTE